MIDIQLYMLLETEMITRRLFPYIKSGVSIKILEIPTHEFKASTKLIILIYGLFLLLIHCKVL